MKKKKIGINASYLRKPNTGIGQVTINFLKTLNKILPDNVEVILYLEEDFSLRLLSANNFTKRIFLPFWKRDDLIRKILWEKYLLPKQLRKDECDFFINLYQSPTDVQAYTEAQHIMLVHDIIPELFPEYLSNWRKKLYWKLTKQGIKSADKIITVSKRTEKDLVQKLGMDQAKITTTYIDADEIYKKEISTEEKEKENARVLAKYRLKPGYILAGGGYEKRKNIEGVVRAYESLLEKNRKEHFLPDFPNLVIYGKILPKKLPLATNINKLLKEFNLTKKVKLLNLVPQKDLPALFRNAKLFVYPSFYEGFGLPVLEAMSVGTPVVTSKFSSLPEVGGDSVLYCDPKNVDDIAMVMKNILIKENLRETLAQRGKERSKQFSWEKFTEKILNII